MHHQPHHLLFSKLNIMKAFPILLIAIIHLNVNIPLSMANTNHFALGANLSRRAINSPGFNDFCASNDTCGPYTVCYQGVCNCNLGYIPSKSGIGCIEKYCTRDEDCIRFPHTICDDRHNSCICTDLLDTDTQLCTTLIRDNIRKILIILGIVTIFIVIISVLFALCMWCYMRRRVRLNLKFKNEEANYLAQSNQALEDEEEEEENSRHNSGSSRYPKSQSEYNPRI